MCEKEILAWLDINMLREISFWSPAGGGGGGGVRSVYEATGRF